jgi:hypothetical protein
MCDVATSQEHIASKTNRDREHSAAQLTADLTASLWVTLTPSSGTNATESPTLHPNTGGRYKSAPRANAQPELLLASFSAVGDTIQDSLLANRSHTVLSSRLRNSALPLYNSGTRSNTPLVFVHWKAPPLVAPAIMTMPPPCIEATRAIVHLEKVSKSRGRALCHTLTCTHKT